MIVAGAVAQLLIADRRRSAPARGNQQRASRALAAEVTPPDAVAVDRHKAPTPQAQLVAQDKPAAWPGEVEVRVLREVDDRRAIGARRSRRKPRSRSCRRRRTSRVPG